MAFDGTRTYSTDTMREPCAMNILMLTAKTSTGPSHHAVSSRLPVQHLWLIQVVLKLVCVVAGEAAR